MDAIIQTYQLTKKFKAEEVIKPFNFSLQKGEICALIGKNGAGKSTFFKLLSGLMIPTAGEIHLFGKSGKDLDLARKRIGFMIETLHFSRILRRCKTWNISGFSGASSKRNGFMKFWKSSVWHMKERNGLKNIPWE